MDEDIKEAFATLTDEMRRGFAQVGARFEQMDSRFEQMESRFEGVDGRLDGMDARFDRMDAKIDDKFEEAKRNFGTLAEQLRGELQLVAESVHVVDRKIDSVGERLTAELSEIRSMIPISFSQLDNRLRSLETDNADLHSRVERLESSTH